MTFFNRIKQDKKYRIKFFAIISFITNFAYAILNLVVGILDRSYWFITIGAYFLSLGIMQLVCVFAIIKQKTKRLNLFVGFLLLFLFIVLVGTVYLSDRFDVISPLHEIVMITIATFTTAKITIAIINLVKSKSLPRYFITLRNSAQYMD